MSAIFVSGHLDLTPEEFEEHYIPQIRKALLHGKRIVVGDARGCDLMVQQWFINQDVKRHDEIWHVGLTIYHMFDRPRNDIGEFQTVGGFKSDDERDAAMTAASDEDIAWVRPGREKSGTARNLARRQNAG